MRVFIVEDQKIILQGIHKLFSHFCSDELCAFSDPSEALSAADSFPPDVVFTDIVMEGMDGLQLIEHLSLKRPKCRYVVISGHADFEYARQAISLGVEGYLLKPIDRIALEELYQRIRSELVQDKPTQEALGRRRRISEEAMGYILANCDRELSISDVATHIHISPNYLSNVFRKETGTSMNEAIRYEQMKAAARLLRTTDMYLYEIAEQLGYKDVKYFSVLFKEYYDITPKAYRQKSIMEVGYESASQPE